MYLLLGGCTNHERNNPFDSNGTSWIPPLQSYTITYDGNDKTSGSVPSSQTKTQSEPLVLSSNLGNLEKTGYSFVGWNTSPDGKGTDYEEGESFTIDQSMTMYAKWISNVPQGMVRLPGGSFFMGQLSDSVVIIPNGFWIDTTEVTQKDYSDLMTNNYGYLPPKWEGYGVGDRYPAYFVNWYSAILYCNARSKRDGRDTVYSYSARRAVKQSYDITDVLYELDEVGINYNVKGYRLPDEDEWEYACRAGSTTEYYWGDDTTPTVVKQYAWYERNAELDYWTVPHAVSQGTQVVAQLKPNDFGLYDMSGNVWEWVNDIDFHNDLPTLCDGEPLAYMRGGCWGGAWGRNASLLRSANIGSKCVFVSSEHIGFRVVLPDL